MNLCSSHRTDSGLEKRLSLWILLLSFEPATPTTTTITIEETAEKDAEKDNDTKAYHINYCADSRQGIPEGVSVSTI